FMQEGLRLSQGVVLAAGINAISALAAGVKASRLRRLPLDLEQVILTTDIPASTAALVTAVREVVMAHRQARVLVDFADLVYPDEIFEVEADLSASFKDLNVVCVTQYDGNAFSAPVALEQFKTHSLAIVGNAFYYENAKHI